jgi:hypothetical protein
VAVTRLRTKRSGLRLASERLLAEEAERERDARHPASAVVLVVQREPVDPVVQADSADGSRPLTAALVGRIRALASVKHRKNAVPVAQARAVDRPDGIPVNVLPYVQPRAQASTAKAKVVAESVVNPNNMAGLGDVRAQVVLAAGSVVQAQTEDLLQVDARPNNAAAAASAAEDHPDRRAADLAAAKQVADLRGRKDRPVVAAVAAADADRPAADNKF